jgi:processive 1,2-diacylglycerol beta-glucosyltransferase
MQLTAALLKYDSTMKDNGSSGAVLREENAQSAAGAAPSPEAGVSMDGAPHVACEPLEKPAWELIIRDRGCEREPEPETTTPPERPCILVVHASAGSGHRTAAIAIAQALEAVRDSSEGVEFHGHRIPPNTDIELVDIFEWGRRPIDGDKTISKFTGAGRPLYDISWRYGFTGRILWGGGTVWSHIYFPGFAAFIAEKRPLAVVSTHITAANVVVGARMLTHQNFPLISVPTDYETEGLWPHRETDLFCVATESMAETLRPRKIPERNILITGIPARDDFQRSYDKAEVRERLGLPLDKKIVLALAGAHLAQPYVHLRSILDKALPYLHKVEDLHLILLPGSDREYAAHLQQECTDLGLDNVTIMDYVEEMSALMSASDLMICKAGGLTVTECLCAQTPMILVGRAYGQEKINVRLLTSMGAALHVTTHRELIDVLGRIAKRPEVLEAMLVNADLLRRPEAAADIAHATYELAYRPEEELQHRIGHFVNFYWGDKPAHIR